MIFFFIQEEVTLHFRASHLDKKDFFGKSDPYLQISRVNEDGRSVSLSEETSVIKFHQVFRIDATQIKYVCFGDELSLSTFNHQV